MIAVCALWSFSAVASAADNPPPFPTNYRALVEPEIKQGFTDPYSLRDVYIAVPQWDGPVPGFTDVHPAWLVCFSANARNSQGGHDGIRTYVYAVRDDRVIWYFTTGYTINEVASSVGQELETAEAWEMQGFSGQEIFNAF